MEDESEKEHWWSCMRTFLFYSEFFEFELERRQNHLNRLSADYAQRLPDITYQKIAQLHDLAEENQDFLNDMVAYHARNMYLDPPLYVTDKLDDPVIISTNYYK